MLWEAVLAYLHLLSAGAAASFKVAEHWLLARPPDRLQVRLLGQVRLGYLLGITSVLATGLVNLEAWRVAPGVPAGASLLGLKVGLFVLLLLLAVPTTRTVVRWNREARSAPAFAPSLRDLETLRATISLETGLLALLPLPAVMLNAGAGYPGLLTP